MIWRVVVTVIAWLAGLSGQLLDGQTFRNALTMLTAVLIGGLPWIPLAVRERGTTRHRAAVVVLSISAIAATMILASLPSAYEFQKHFNERRAVP